jgi:membrane fusion protein (multidrug efflux system)
MSNDLLSRIASLGGAVLLVAGALITGKAIPSAVAQAGPPAVGVVEAVRRPITRSNEFIGRVQALERVELVARVSASLVEQMFNEGAEVKTGDPLYRLERAPYEAEVAVRQAAVTQAQAELANARLALDRARDLRSTGAGTQVALDNAIAQERSGAAQVLAAQAQVRLAEVNLGYTEIRAPINGRIGRSAVDVGNVVGPGSGVLAVIVSQDPMHVVFSVAIPTALDLRSRYADRGGFEAVTVKLRLPDDRIYEQAGRLEFIDIEAGRDTDTLMMRGTIPNPVLPQGAGGGARLRELINGQFVTVILEAIEPIQALLIPREAVLSDQRGDFVYVVDAESKAQRRGVRLGPSTTPAAAVITEGLREGEQVVLEGLQRVQPNAPVSAAPADFSPELERAAATGAPATGR